MADIKINVIVDGKEAAQSFKVIANESQKAADKVEKGFSDAGRIFDNFIANVASSVAIGAFNKLASGAKVLFDTFIVDGVKAAQEQETALNNLNAALVRSGEFTAQASQDMMTFASAMQDSTNFGDELILQQLALAKAFGASNEQAKVAVQAATELSVAAGIDLEEATRRVGKAMQGTTKEISKFAPAISQLTDEELKAGRAAEILIQTLGGTAAAQLNTFQGAVNQTKNKFSDLQEVTGGFVTQNAQVVAIVKEAGNAFQQVGVFLENNKEQIRDLVTSAFLFMIDAIPFVIQGLQAVVEGIQKVRVGFLVITGQFEKAEEAIKGFAETKRFFDNAAQGAREFGERARIAAEEAKTGQDALTASLTAQSEQRQKDLEIQREIESFNLETEERMKAFQEAQSLAFNENALQQQQRLQAENAFLNERLNNEKTYAKNKELIDKQLQKNEATIQKQREANLSSSLGTISSLQSSSSKELFAIGKAAALAQGFIDGQGAILKAYNAAPPPFNFALAALVGVAVGANLAKIASAKPPGLQGGIDSVPGVGTRDNFPAILAPGERVVPSKTNQDLTTFLGNQGSQESILLQILATLQTRSGVVVNVGGRTILDTLNDELEAGGELSLA